MGQYATAASALSDLADQETRFLGKKKVHTTSLKVRAERGKACLPLFNKHGTVRFFIVQTLLSLAKLSALAGADDASEDFVAQKNQQLYLTEVQITQRLQPASVKDKGNRSNMPPCFAWLTGC
jgi:hypothetical protein